MVEKLNETEIDAGLESLSDWSRSGDSLQRTYSFADFLGSMAFVNAIAARAEEVQHPPAVGEAEHGAHLLGRGLPRAMGDGLVEQAERVAHRALGRPRHARDDAADCHWSRKATNESGAPRRSQALLLAEFDPL